MKLVRDTRRVTVAGLGTLDTVMRRLDRPFNDLTIWGVPSSEGVVVGGRFASAPANITAVDITAVSATALDGAGTLTYTVVGTLLDWQAPGAGAPGAAQDVHLGGEFVLAGGDGSTVTVVVAAAGLPVGNQVDAIAVTTTFPTPRARAFTSQVFFGPTAQAAPTARITDEGYRIYDPGDTGRIWPANEPTSNIHQASNRVRGFPVTVRIANGAADPLVMTIDFVYMVTDNG